MSDLFNIKQNDTSPALAANLTDVEGDPIDLSGAAARLHMREMDGTVVIDTACTITSYSGGGVRYDWQTGDTDTPGHYLAEFQVTYADLTIETFPNYGNFRVRIHPEVS